MPARGARRTPVACVPGAIVVSGLPAGAITALAAAPIALILATMLVLRWSASRAGVAGLAAAAAIAATAFDVGREDGALRGFAGSFAEGAFLAATILWILWPALALHAHQQRCGALDALRGGLAGLTGQPALQVLVVGWFVALFFEGAAGFGTPVALVAPLLVAIGLPPVRAVVVALLGHAVGVSFGALGTPVLAQVALAGLDAGEIAWRTAALHAALGGIAMAFVVRALAAPDADETAGAPRPVGAGERGTSGPRTPSAPWAAFAAVAFLVPSVALAATLGPELPTLGGALAGGALFGAALRWRAGRRARGSAPAGGLARAAWPYAVLVVLVLVPLLLGAWLLRVPTRDVLGSLAEAARRLVPVVVALVSMLCLSRLMLHAGMVEALQSAAVSGVGRAWPLFAPALGALGSVVTGSATASNVLFTTLQAQTAASLGLPVALIVAAQGVGAAIGNVVCPHNVVAGAATVGLAGREGEVLRRTAWPCAVYLLAGGALVAALALR